MAARRVAKVGIDVGYKMGDGVGAFWRHSINTEPIAVYSVVLAAIGIYPSFSCRGEPTNDGTLVCVFRNRPGVRWPQNLPT